MPHTGPKNVEYVFVKTGQPSRRITELEIELGKKYPNAENTDIQHWAIKTYLDEESRKGPGGSGGG